MIATISSFQIIEILNTNVIIPLFGILSFEMTSKVKLHEKYEIFPQQSMKFDSKLIELFYKEI